MLIVDAESDKYYTIDEYDAQKGVTAYSFTLVDGMIPKKVSDNLKGALDSMCPALKSSSKLQEKAMRIAAWAYYIVLFLFKCHLAVEYDVLLVPAGRPRRPGMTYQQV